MFTEEKTPGLSECKFVTTTDGFVPIIDIAAGDQVYAYHQTAGSVGVYDVVAQWSHLDEQVTFVTIDGELIETTPWHDFYTDEGWQDAGELVTGNLVLSLDGDYGVVDSIRTTDAIQWMYDITVEDVHTFAVGTGQWVVHNQIPCPRGIENLQNRLPVTNNPDTTQADEAFAILDVLNRDNINTYGGQYIIGETEIYQRLQAAGVKVNTRNGQLPTGKGIKAPEALI